MVSFLKQNNHDVLLQNVLDKTMCTEEKLSIMKMEICYKEATDKNDQQQLDNVKDVIYKLLIRLGLPDKDGNFYIGNNYTHDYAHFGMVFEVLNNWTVFLKRVEIWNFYDEYGEVEDFASTCKQKAGM